MWIRVARSSILASLQGEAARPTFEISRFMPDTTGHMRILKVVQSYFPFQERGGPVFKVRALATGLAKRGHQVTVLTADLGFGKGNGFC